MKCALFGRESKTKDYICVNTPDQKGIYVHSAPCEWSAKNLSRMVHDSEHLDFSDRF